MTRILRAEMYGVDHGEPLSWAGECPWTGGLCLGSERGGVYFPAPSGCRSEIKPVEFSSDAINGVAFQGKHIAVTSRNEVEIGMLVDVTDPEKPIISPCEHSFRGGAHGVIAVGRDAFVAPIGIDGVLITRILGDRTIETGVARLSEAPLNFYRLARLGHAPDSEVLACAARRDGLLAFKHADGHLQGQFVQHKFGDSDLVDVCPIGDTAHPLAVACLSRSRGVLLVRNVLEEEPPIELGFADLKGSAYSLLSARGSLFLLTDRYLATLPDLATRFLNGESLDIRADVALMPTDADEIFLRGDRSLLLAEDVVAEFAIDDLLSGLSGRGSVTPRGHNGAESRDFEYSVVETRMRPAAARAASTRGLSFQPERAA
ncbi:hypothetical protein OJF2_03430 [Aquisphaera giovannonii]|uniref:Phytase-like domain-containing protein n=1 Tax=Aquisphaera giovannonii TaxID=406548 RepID=A0A5B9VTM9_9BACT|nr:hypothetical protein [Aquisphaera giovannonii]QEH31876.1 hypothetical protein OJF2_03430 [Aquisphaera giovannonii]